jgi:hypothetical protein
MNATGRKEYKRNAKEAHQKTTISNTQATPPPVINLRPERASNCATTLTNVFNAPGSYGQAAYDGFVGVQS